MKNYKVKITEKLELTVEVEANSRQEAEQIVSDHWRNSKYILDSECFTDVEFKAVMPEKSRADRDFAR